MLMCIEKKITKKRTKGKKKIHDSTFIKTESMIKNFSKMSYRESFFDELKQRYNLEDNRIKIKTDFLIYLIFLYSIDKNDSLNKIKNTNKKRYDFIVNQILLRVNLQINEIEDKIKLWSENKFFIEIKKQSITIKIKKNNKILSISKDEMKKKYSQIICECIFLFESKLKEIQKKVTTLITQDLDLLF